MTCGIYGWMFHTRYLGTEPEALEQFGLMIAELSQIVAMIPGKADPEVDAKSRALCDAISEFVRRFP